jgi:hypothetical protein
LILLKFLNGENYEGFYNALDALISESIDNFKNLDICDKIYIYIAYYFYSVRTSISLKSDKFDSVEVPLTVLLDSLESRYKKEYIEVPFYNWKAKVHYPTSIYFDEPNTIVVDLLSSLRFIEGLEIKSEQIEDIRKSTPTKVLNDFYFEVIHNMELKADIAKDIPGTDDITENILNPSIFYSIAFIYKDLLDNFYNMQYLLTHYVRVSWEAILEMTPIETTILYKNFIEDKERQNEKSKNGSINVHDPNVADTLNGF